MNAVFYCADLGGSQVLLTGPEGRHAATVRRMRVGEAIDLVDGCGTRCTGVVSATTKDTVTVDVASRVAEPAPSPRITVVQALAKGDRGELAVELATEVGVDAIVPWAAARCVVRWEGERGAKALERWRSTAREAAKQARRSWFPVVTDSVTTAALCADWVGSIGGSVKETPIDPTQSRREAALLVLHESATTRLTEVELTGDVVLVVGPEGGVSDEELGVLLGAGGTAVRLGESVLRTSTAGAVAAAVVSSRTGRW